MSAAAAAGCAEVDWTLLLGSDMIKTFFEGNESMCGRWYFFLIELTFDVSVDCFVRNLRDHFAFK